MIISESRDYDRIAEVLRHPDIYPRISDDNSPPPDDFRLPKQGMRYILGVDGDPFGVFIIHQVGDKEKVHIQVTPEHRWRARDFAYVALCFTSLPLMAEIPICYQNVINFAESFGFELQDVRDTGYMKDGKRYKSAFLERAPWIQGADIGRAGNWAS